MEVKCIEDNQYAHNDHNDHSDHDDHNDQNGQNDQVSNSVARDWSQDFEYTKSFLKQDNMKGLRVHIGLLMCCLSLDGEIMMIFVESTNQKSRTVTIPLEDILAAYNDMQRTLYNPLAEKILKKYIIEGKVETNATTKSANFIELAYLDPELQEIIEKNLVTKQGVYVRGHYAQCINQNRELLRGTFKI